MKPVHHSTIVTWSVILLQLYRAYPSETQRITETVGKCGTVRTGPVCVTFMDRVGYTEPQQAVNALPPTGLRISLRLVRFGGSSPTELSFRWLFLSPSPQFTQ